MSEDDIIYINNILPTLHGWCTVDKALTLYNTIINIDSPLCVELGVFAGRSLLPIALAAKYKTGKAYGIDPWEKDAALEGNNSELNDDWWSNIDYEHFFNYTHNVLKDANVDNYCTILRNKSRDVINKFDDMTIDFLHQDGNHSEEVTVEEVNRWYNKVKIGGYWAFDDSDWATTLKAQQLLVDKGYKLLSENDGKWQLYQRIN